ncbi:uncharacterized protein [Eurosta solidaginis]|uniref:uncharacterized protein n=1 Tax=Eurosta solidaginis TaxID=178769 RepID=UPI0035308584
MGNPIWFVFWFLIFWFISFFVAFLAAFFYIIVYTLEVIFRELSGLSGLLLQGIQFPHYCLRAMLDFKSPCA